MNDPFYIGKKEVKIPVFQGGMGIGISLGRLAGAVAKEGGVGTISISQIGFREPHFYQDPLTANRRAIHKELKKAREIAPDGIIAFNIMVAMNQYEEHVKEAAEAGADLIVSGAGLPVDLPAYTKEYDIALAPIVSTEKSAKVILKYWSKKYQRTADAVIIEGPLAGGHLGFRQNQLEKFDQDAYDIEVQKIRKIVAEYEELYGRKIPVILGGGIYTAEDCRHAMSLGVDGIQVASRFVTTEECDADENYKMAYLNARKEDIAIIKSPVGMPGRAIMNPFIKRIMEGERKAPNHCLSCIHTCNPANTPYCITEALIHAAKGEIDQGLIFCGAKSYQAEKIETVKEVLNSFQLI
ncbi:MAG: nitronate monooxygenase family protein [Lachnospiraceae bacterium]|nr:nitronate monooxygenase family protein [Lachnospiraceae bacterium]